MHQTHPLFCDEFFYNNTWMDFIFIQFEEGSNLAHLSNFDLSLTRCTMFVNKHDMCLLRIFFQLMDPFLWGGISLSLICQMSWFQWQWVNPKMGHKFSLNHIFFKMMTKSPFFFEPFICSIINLITLSTEEIIICHWNIAFDNTKPKQLG
jgi:hypothetical protein